MSFEETVKNLPALFAAIFAAILFIQSGLDKVFDWRGNLEWLEGHFSKTPLSGMVAPMLAAVTVMEVVTGFLAAAGVFYFIFSGSALLMFAAAIVGTTSITALFFGQRVAKDYVGAAVLVPYFIFMLILLALTNPYGAIR